MFKFTDVTASHHPMYTYGCLCVHADVYGYSCHKGFCIFWLYDSFSSILLLLLLFLLCMALNRPILLILLWCELSARRRHAWQTTRALTPFWKKCWRPPDHLPYRYTGWPKKSKPPPIFQKIVLKIANEIRFLRKVKVWIKHYNTIRW